GWNPSCGDEIQVSLRLLNGTIAEIRFSGQGCSISQSSASMMTDETHGQPLERVRAVADAMQRMLTDEDFDLDSTDIGDLEALQGVARFPLRVKCALLAWKVLEQALAQATGQAAESDSDIQTRIASASG
ncbi:MAG: SUF system NifU family Fe-S cluster assembly protein, partial [Dehalococcoidia bacterium]